VATLAQIRQGIADVLTATDDRLTVYPYWVSNLHLPAAVITVDDADYLHVFTGTHMVWPLRLYVLVQYADAEFAQVALDEYIDPFGARSIVDALQDEDLELAKTQVAVTGVSDYGDFEAAGIEHVGAIINLTVRTERA